MSFSDMRSVELLLLLCGLVLLAPPSLVAALNLLGWRNGFDAKGGRSSLVSVLIPARNEEANIRACVESVVAQGEIVAEVLVYNDGSSDNTQAILDDLLVEHQGLVKQVAARELPDGWVGKPHACDRLAAAAGSPWLLFLDADSRLEPDGIGTLMSAAHRLSATLVSAWPRIEMTSFSERLLMPLLNFVVFSMFPAPIARKRPGASLGLAHGACLAAERSTYETLGGHSLVRDKLFEDTALARAWRGAGETSHVVDGRGIVRVRMYEDFRGIWDGFSKNYYPAFARTGSFVGFQAYMAVAYIVLPVLAVATVLAGVASPMFSVVAVASFVPRLLVTVRFRHPAWSVLAHPAVVLVMITLGARSWWLSTRGRGVEWKGRRYAANGAVLTDE